MKKPKALQFQCIIEHLDAEINGSRMFSYALHVGNAKNINVWHVHMFVSESVC